jgi:hypothetical protein
MGFSFREKTVQMKNGLFRNKPRICAYMLLYVLRIHRRWNDSAGEGGGQLLLSSVTV